MCLLRKIDFNYYTAEMTGTNKISMQLISIQIKLFAKKKNVEYLTMAIQQQNGTESNNIIDVDDENQT